MTIQRGVAYRRDRPALQAVLLGFESQRLHHVSEAIVESQRTVTPSPTGTAGSTPARRTTLRVRSVSGAVSYAVTCWVRLPGPLPHSSRTRTGTRLLSVGREVRLLIVTPHQCVLEYPSWLRTTHAGVRVPPLVPGSLSQRQRKRFQKPFSLGSNPRGPTTFREGDAGVVWRRCRIPCGPSRSGVQLLLLPPPCGCAPGARSAPTRCGVGSTPTSRANGQ